jgi:outer membrane receptor protein involved in Fe transport
MRGLSGRYLNVQLNGAVLPSADPERNSVPLDLFPSGLLDNIVTAKTFTPDRPGDFTGGAVNLGTRDFPERLAVSAAVSSGFNTSVEPGSDLLLYEGGRVGLFGGDAPALPDALADGAEVPGLGQALTDPAAATRLDALSKAFDGVMAPSAFATPVNQSASLSVGNRVSVAGRPLGFIGAFNWSRSATGYADGVTARYKLPGNVAETDDLDLQLALADQRGGEEVLLGGLANLSYRLSPRHELGLNLIYNRGAESAGRFQAGALPRDLSEGQVFRSRTLGFVERGLASAQLRGDHALTARGLRVAWNASAAHSAQDEPDVRFFADHYTPAGADTLYAILTAIYTAPTRLFRELDETTYTGNLDVTVPFALGLSGRLKTGGSLLLRARTYRERRYEYRQPAGLGYDGDPFTFFSDENTGVIGEDERGRPVFGNYLIDATEPVANYDGDQTVAAGYLMADVALSARLRAVGGARLETTRIGVVSQDAAAPQGDLDAVDVLPALSLIYGVTDQMNLRVAYGRTLARPTFRELAPFASFSYIGDYVFVGNPALQRTLIDNADLRWEWFARPGEVFAVSAFYKRFDGPIERVANPLAANTEIQFRNVGDGAVYGLELEARRRLDLLPGLLAHLEVGGNATLLRSSVDIAPDELALIRAYDPAAADTRSLQGQSEYLANLDLSYNDDARGTVVGLYYNLFGPRLYAVGAAGSPSLYEQPQPVLDLVASQRLGRGLTLKASAKNLLDASFRITQTFKGREYVNEEYRRGRVFSLGLSLAF